MSSADGTGTTTATTLSDGLTTLPTNLPSTVDPIGDPIPIGQLTMSANDIGPLDFGSDGDEILGRLAATFGQPTQDTGFIVGNGSFGECPGDSVRIVQWGPLVVVVEGEQNNATFINYRMDLQYGGITSQTTDISTLSGLRVGDTVAQLESIYGEFLIDYVVDPVAGLTFELRAEAGGDLLLWGPVDGQDDNDRVTGIYAPDPCGR